ncbi:MAG: chemotaxis protein CheA [Gammaproteobacteria bacterium]|nr:MAG: chemotaxis protein CheA [Gammaproteobacteria bacterium]
MTKPDVDLLLVSVDCLRGMLAAHRDGGSADAARAADLQRQLTDALNETAPTPVAAPAPATSPASGDQITEAEFDNLLDQLHGKTGAPGVKSAAPAPTPAAGEEITEAEFEALLDQLHGKGTAPAGAGNNAKPQCRDALSAMPRDAKPDWRIRFKPHPKMMQSGNDPVRIFRELAALGSLHVTADLAGLPMLPDMHPEESYLGWTLELISQANEAEIREIFAWVEDEADLVIESLRAGSTRPAPAAAPDAAPAAKPTTTAIAAAKPAASPVPAATAPKPAATGETASIRVGIDKIDALINMVGELVITQSMLNQLSANFDMHRLPKLLEGLAQLDRNTRELQESVMRIRMLPVSFAFSRLPRLVHDLSAKLDKKVELTMFGEQTEMDKTVMEKLGDPLVHLVRNSLDHGIEAPAARKAAGKPEVGSLTLNAYHKGGNVVIEISDDGAGLNKDKILKKARERALVGPDEQLPDDKVYDLICMPGFSTADQVSDVSGRGVGMDVVKRNIKSLGGMLEIESQAGSGTTMRIRLPLTLAILDGQIVRVGQEIYIIPLVSIVETIQIGENQVNEMVGKAEVFRLRDAYLPIIRLYEVFSLIPRTTKLSEGLLVVVEGDGQRIGLFVDELLGQQQVVIKSLEANFRRVEAISGATILGDGTVALILDIPGLVKLRDAFIKDVSPQAVPLEEVKAA